MLVDDGGRGWSEVEKANKGHKAVHAFGAVIIIEQTHPYRTIPPNVAGIIR